jgi:hypothetical protein
VILSAARSGSKLFRDLICSSTDCSCYPYDVNYVWKYGNYQVRHDELSPAQVDEEKKRFIREFLVRPARRDGAAIAVDKTVSNSLRVDYVRAVLPEAKIIHLIRDGRDVIPSAMDCWQKSGASTRNQDYRVMLRKVIEFPPQGWRYGLEYLRDNLGMLLGKRKHRKTWGPRFAGIDDAVATRPLVDVCALQWEHCIDRALNGLSGLVEGKDFITVRYETLLLSANSEIDRLVSFLGIRDAEALRAFANERFDSRNLGKWRDLADGDLESHIETLTRPTLDRLGYA